MSFSFTLLIIGGGKQMKRSRTIQKPRIGLVRIFGIGRINGFLMHKSSLKKSNQRREKSLGLFKTVYLM
jgi:hypothetical protein